MAKEVSSSVEAKAPSLNVSGPKPPVSTGKTPGLKTPIKPEDQTTSEAQAESAEQSIIWGQTPNSPSDSADQTAPPADHAAEEESNDSAWWMFGAGAGAGMLVGLAINRGNDTTTHRSDDIRPTLDAKLALQVAEPKPEPKPEPEPEPLVETPPPVVSLLTPDSGVTDDTSMTDVAQAGDFTMTTQVLPPVDDIQMIDAATLAFPSHSGGVIHDVAGNEALQNDTTYLFSDYKLGDAAPKIESIEYGHTNFYALNSKNPFYDPKYVNNDNIFHPKDEMYFKVAFTENVYVTGVPKLKLSIGGVDRYAELSSGSGTHELWFKYTVQDSDHDLNGISVAKDALFKNGGSIADANGNVLQGFEAGDFGLNAQVEFNTPDQTLSITAAGLSKIDLGAVGHLIKPVEVEGKWYYLLDVNKDGRLDTRDMLTHDQLEKYFTQTLSNENGGINTTNDQVHYGWFAAGSNNEMIRASLPTLGLDSNLDWRTNKSPVNSPLELNKNYNDLIAIWDAFNQGGGKSKSGIPSEWNYSALTNHGKIWSSTAWFTTPDFDMHAAFTLSKGDAEYLEDFNSAYVVFQVL